MSLPRQIHSVAITALFLGGGMTLALSATSTLTAVAGEWPEILGPTRNGVAAGETLDPSWPEDGPKQLWSRSIGTGYAGPAVADDKVVLFHRVGDIERVEAFDARSGKPLWKTDFTASYRGGVDPDVGPRCVPVIVDKKIIAYGAAGAIHCLGLEDGKKIWSLKLYDIYKGSEGYFGAGNTPVVIGDKVLVNAGGREDSGILAINLADGRVLWKSTEEKASYSGATTWKDGDKTWAVFLTRYNLVIIDPETGKVRATSEFGQRGPTVNAATPLIFGDQIFLTASYGIGAKLLKIEGDALKSVWADDRTLSSQYNTPVPQDKVIFGIHGREDLGTADLRCVEWGTGKVLWNETEFGCAHLIRAGKHILALKPDGKMVLFTASSTDFEKLAEAEISEDATRALPALAGGLVYIRSTNTGGGALMCFDLRGTR